MRSETLHTRVLWLIMLAGFLMRIAYALEQPTLVQFSGATGGDSSWYLVNGAGFFSGQEHGRIRGLPFYISNIKTAPLYIIFVGIFQPILPDHETIIAIRLLQCLASIATVYLAGRMAITIAGDARAGIIAAALMAFHPAFITEPANIATETLYIFFLALGLWLYIEYVAGPVADPRAHRLSGAMTLAGAAFGLATLTRGVAALFPLVIALHLLCLGRRRLLRRLAAALPAAACGLSGDRVVLDLVQPLELEPAHHHQRSIDAGALARRRKQRRLPGAERRIAPGGHRCRYAGGLRGRLQV